MANLLRSRKTFIAVALLVVPPVSWATVVYLHDDYGYFRQDDVGLLTSYFVGAAVVVTLLGVLTKRTKRDIAIVVLGTAASCLAVLGVAVLWALTHYPLS